jgi:hypothetical protein
MHEGKKHKESSYQPIKDKDGKVILTSEQARNVDEDHHEFDHKPAKSEIEKAEFINTKMKKLRKKSQQIKAVADLNKAISSAKAPSRKSALNMLGVPSPLNKISGPCKTAAKKKFKVWPSAYASGWGVRCTKAGGPSKFGNKSKK